MVRFDSSRRQFQVESRLAVSHLLCLTVTSSPIPPFGPQVSINLRRWTWSLLNQFRTGQGRCALCSQPSQMAHGRIGQMSVWWGTDNESPSCNHVRKPELLTATWLVSILLMITLSRRGCKKSQWKHSQNEMITYQQAGQQCASETVTENETCGCHDSQPVHNKRYHGFEINHKKI